MNCWSSQLDELLVTSACSNLKLWCHERILLFHGNPIIASAGIRFKVAVMDFLMSCPCKLKFGGLLLVGGSFRTV